MITICSDDTSIEYINDTVMGLLPYMESDEAFYWESVIDFNYKLQKFKIKRLNLFKMICMCEETSIESMTVNNNYLQGEKEYESLRKVLGQVNFNFKCSNAINLSRDFSNKKYVFLILSNILDYLYECWQKGWTYEQLLDYIKDLEKIMAPQGLILIHYILNYIRSSTGAVKTPIIRGTNISVKDIYWGKIQQISPHPILGRIDGILFTRCKSK